MTTTQTRTSRLPKAKEQRWMIVTNGSIHGIKHSELTVLRKIPRHQTVRSTVSVFTVSKPFALAAGLVLLALLFVLAGCALPLAQKGGTATTTVNRAGRTNTATLHQSANPKEPSMQLMESEETTDYVLPAGTTIGLRGPTFSSETAAGPQEFARCDRPVPVRIRTKDRSETTIGAAQKDTVREWAAKAAQMQPVMWAGILMMTLVTGILVYFGWWTKAGVAAGVGIGMVVLAQTLPDHGSLILLGGLGTFAFVALLVLYAYYKGQLDRNGNGIPDFLERRAHPPLVS